MKKGILNTFILVAICAVMTCLLAVTNHFTKDIIAENLEAQAGAALSEILPEGVTATEVTDPALIEQFPKSVTKAYTASNGWCVVEITTTGYADGLSFLCAVDGEGTVQKMQYVSDNETDTYGGVQLEDGTIFALFTGITADTLDGVDVHTGATETAKGVRAAVNDAINTAALLRGEDVDTRTPEEILADNLNTALPAAEGKFSKLYFASEAAIDFIYAAENGSGFVCVVGEVFVGLDATGKVITEGVADEAVTAAESKAAAALSHTVADTADTEINSNITEIKKTAEGNYLVFVNGLGFGYFGDEEKYQPAKNIPIKISVLITPEGKILRCLTLEHKESAGFGDVCGTEEYYGQYTGKTEADLGDVDAISQATITSDGYMKAVERALAAVKILEGGNN